ncbi:MAG: phytoene desaturase family protein [Candidatus Helarchaeota archaeon]
MTDYDCIIIGSGIGGSASAAMMAHAGYKTLLLEKNSFIGGVTSSYQKEGFIIDVAIHFFPAGFRGRFGKILRRIDMRKTTSLRFASHLENNIAFKVKGQKGITRAGSILNAAMPKGPSQGGAPSAAIPSDFKSMGLTKDDQKELMKIMVRLLRMSKKQIQPLYDEKCTVTEYINRFTKNPAVHGIIAFITGGMFTISPRIASAAEFIKCFQEMSLTFDLSYPYGASIAIPRAFIEGMEHYGGKLKTNARVSKILVEDGKVKGVVVNDEEITSNLILSNASIKNTLYLAGENNFDKDYRTRVKNLVPSYSSITFKVALKKPIVENIAMLNLFHGELSTLESATTGRKAKSTGFMTVIPSNCDPSLAPKGRQLMIFGTMSPGEGVKDWDSWTKAYYNNLLEYLPEIEDSNLFVDSTNPNDLVKVSGKALGPVESTACTPDQVGPYRISSEMPIEGLFVVGDSAGTNTSGIGTQLAADSALKCVAMILKRRKKPN